MRKSEKDILIALLPNPKDLGILAKFGWYRIPAGTKQVPKIVKHNKVKLISFYQPGVFKKDAFAIRWYGKVNRISITERKNLFPQEPYNEKSNNSYYKIEIDKLLRLPRAIISLRHRRVLFITTTLKKFEIAEEINDLFYESPIEELLWKRLKNLKMWPERQFLETIKEKNFFLDFALFCRERKLAVECDGDTYHMKKESVRKDKQRDNLLESKGWNVLRYTTYDLTEHLDDSVNQIRETVNQYGGIELPDSDSKYKYYPDSHENTLFDETIY